MRHALLLFPLLLACGPTDGEPAWALDPIWVEPTEDGGIYGFQQWLLFSEAWDRSPSSRHFVCGIVVELHGWPEGTEPPGDDEPEEALAMLDEENGEEEEEEEEETACLECEHAWEVQTRLLESDCPEGLASDPAWLSLSRLAIGRVDPALEDDIPFPARTHGGYAAYGEDAPWEPHGYAFAEGLDTRGQVADSRWNEEQAFHFRPAFAWDLN